MHSGDEPARGVHTPRVRALAALVASLWLPAGGTFTSVQPAGSALFLSGFADRGPGCIWATVDPVQFRLVRAHRGTCAAAARATGRLTPSIVYDPKSQWQDVVLSNGRVVFRYQDSSDTKPQWVYGPDSLWIYDVNTEAGPVAVRVSLASGRIVQRTPMPKLYRPVLAADADGLWLVAATNGGLGTGPQALFNIVPGATTPTVVHRGGRAALWLLAREHTVWMEQIAGTSTVSLWRFDGMRERRLAKPRFFGAAAVWGGGSVWVAGANRRCNHELVVRVDPGTGRASPVANVATGSCEPLGYDPQGLIFSRGSLFFVDEPWLHRIRP